MLSNGRVRKGVTFQQDITNALIDYFTEKDFPQRLECELNATTSIGFGKCYSVKISKKEVSQP
jgi:hypothetical protein